MSCNCKNQNIGTLYQDGSVLPNPDFHINTKRQNFEPKEPPSTPFTVRSFPGQQEVNMDFSNSGDVLVSFTLEELKALKKLAQKEIGG